MLANPYQNFLHLVLTLFPLYKGENKHQETFSYFSVKHYTCKKTIVYGGSHSITLTWKKKKKAWKLIQPEVKQNSPIHLLFELISTYSIFSVQKFHPVKRGSIYPRGVGSVTKCSTTQRAITVIGSINNSSVLKTSQMKFLPLSFCSKIRPPAWQGSSLMHEETCSTEGRVHASGNIT